MPDDPTPEDESGPAPQSLLPYDTWTEEALRLVAARALAHVAENGLPGDHHFYITFRTDLPGVVIPPRLKAQYPHEMTIVLQHQFWDLAVDDTAGVLTVGLSFSGTPATLRIPLSTLTGFADPHVRYGLRFQPTAPLEALPAPPPSEPEQPAPDPTPQVVSLDAFRRKPRDGA